MVRMNDAARSKAYQRRVWRLAFLLTGDTGSAESLFTQIMRNHKRIESVEPERLDRMIIMYAREHPQHTERRLRPDPHLNTLYELLPQPLEAWLLVHVEQLEQRSAAKAMDCSITALRLHRDAAEEYLTEQLGDGWRALADRLRQAADELDAIPAIERWQAQRGRGCLFKTLLLLAGLAAGGAAGWFVFK